MIPGIDSYCFHRQFGDPYPGLQRAAEERWDVFEAIRRAAAMGARGISLETAYMPLHEADFLPRLRDALAAAALAHPVWAWGHPDGLRSGADRAAEADLVAAIDDAREAGATVMRICGGSRRTRPASWAAHRAALLPALRRVAAVAADRGVVLALENHIDLTTDELLDLVAGVDSPALSVCFDTANQLRLLEDPMVAATRLAPLARATHLKNVVTHHGDPRSFAFWPSVRLQDGIIDIAAILGLLRDADYDGLLAIEIDYLHPDAGEEVDAVVDSLRWLEERAGGPCPLDPIQWVQGG